MGQLFNTNRKMRNNIMQNQYQPEFINFRHSVSVLTYNILAQVYCEKSHFSYAQDHNLNFQNRAQKILKQLRNFNSDILCLQEVDNFDFYQEQLRKLNYHICFVQRPSRNDGCLIAFKIDKFKLLNCCEYSLDKMATNYGLTIQYQRQNVFIIVKLEHIITKKQIVIGNIHTFWNPNQEDLKYFQIVQFVQKMEQEKENDEQMLIFCGDFNSLPQSNQIQYISKNKPIIERIERSSSQIKLIKQIYEDYGPPKCLWQSAFQPFPKYTNYTKDFKGCIDYIFYHNVSLEKILRMPDENFLKEETALPNQNFPSDHLPMLAFFDFHE